MQNVRRNGGNFTTDEWNKAKGLAGNGNFSQPSSDNTSALAGEGTGISANDLTRP